MVHMSWKRHVSRSGDAVVLVSDDALMIREELVIVQEKSPWFLAHLVESELPKKVGRFDCSESMLARWHIVAELIR